MDQINVRYEVRELEQRKRDRDELIRAGIVVMSDLLNIKDSALLLNVELNDNDELLSKELTITPLGTISNPMWALHDLDLESEYVKNLHAGTNLYNLYLIVEGRDPILAMRDIYIRKDNFEADVEHYIELDMSFRMTMDDSGYVH